jgi:uncharacterized protein
MTSVITNVKRYPVLAYYVMTFAISWGGVLLVIGGPGGIPATTEQFDSMIMLVVLALMAGPSVAGLLLTGIVFGRTGYRELLSRLRRWRVGARWYAAALLAGPLVMLAIPLPLSLVLPDFLPGVISTDTRATLLILAIASGLIGGIFEELGWTGFVIPRLRLRFSVLATGLIVGALWGAWHLLVNLWSSGTSTGAFSLALLLHTILFSVAILPAFRVLMVWVYDGSGSLFVAMLMHASLIASNVLLVPALDTGMPLAAWSLLVAVAAWIAVAAVAVASGGQLSRPEKTISAPTTMQRIPQ